MFTAPNKITLRLRRLARFVPAAAALAAFALFSTSCGAEDNERASDAEKANDVSILNTALGYETVAVDAYRQALPFLRGEELALVRELRAQEQEHIDAITKAIRGLGGRAAPEPIAVTLIAPADADGALTIAYERVSAAIAEDMAAVNKLASPWPRTLIAMIAANEGQQLTLLRQMLGAGPAASVPEAFENGEIPLTSSFGVHMDPKRQSQRKIPPAG